MNIQTMRAILKSNQQPIEAKPKERKTKEERKRLKEMIKQTKHIKI